MHPCFRFKKIVYVCVRKRVCMCKYAIHLQYNSRTANAPGPELKAVSHSRPEANDDAAVRSNAAEAELFSIKNVYQMYNREKKQ